ncbi:Oligopeptide transporter 3 [Mycena venus]|uniref:Oligopeptide transporter 3 n=1 Tax=Mycena venus TaxID=2733690 RepID=A0A8H7CIL7_9AGAR|nr:Oligopeptide transporter 3 [Mycena venus]
MVIDDPVRRASDVERTPSAPSLGDEKYDEKNEKSSIQIAEPVMGEVYDDVRAIDLDDNGKERPIVTDVDVATRLISLEDEPTLPAFTFRMWFLGLGLSCFGAVLGQIFYFRPQTISVSQLFLQIFAYILGVLMQEIIPGPGNERYGYKTPNNAFWRFMNPGPFNLKEHVAITIFASTAAGSALAISIFAADDLYYNIQPNAGVGIFTLIGSQLLGYGLGGIMRAFLVYPTYMVYPSLLPTVQLFDALHRGKKIFLQKKRVRFFWSCFIGIFIWEWFPEVIYCAVSIAPVLLLTASQAYSTEHSRESAYSASPSVTAPGLPGFSAVRRVTKDSASLLSVSIGTMLVGNIHSHSTFSLISIIYLVQAVAVRLPTQYSRYRMSHEGQTSIIFPRRWFARCPLHTTFHSTIALFRGAYLHVRLLSSHPLFIYCRPVLTRAYHASIAFCALYANNVWQAQNFPWLSQELFYENGTQYDQLAILDENFRLDPAALAVQGLPWFASSQVLYKIGTNLSIGATITHVALWYGKDIIEVIKRYRAGDAYDPHLAKMKVYPEVPMWWYILVFIGSFAMAMATIYTGGSGMPGWGLVVGIIISAVFLPFVTTVYAITGFTTSMQNLVQIIGASIMPGSPQTNMYFTLYGFNTLQQALALVQDLKMGVTIHQASAARDVHSSMSWHCSWAAFLNYVIMKVIISTHREILLDVQGSNIWSGQQVQTFNADSVSWGALGNILYAPSGRYGIVPFSILIGLIVPVPFYILHRFYPKLGANHVMTPVLCWTLGYLSVGINTSVFTTFLLALFSQYYLRRYRPRWFRKYNFLLSAALDGGTQVMVFVFTFAVGGGSGKVSTMPNWALNPVGNPDYCMRLT